jgi:hypothetical protein
VIPEGALVMDLRDGSKLYIADAVYVKFPTKHMGLQPGDMADFQYVGPERCVVYTGEVLAIELQPCTCCAVVTLKIDLATFTKEQPPIVVHLAMPNGQVFQGRIQDFAGAGDGVDVNGKVFCVKEVQLNFDGKHDAPAVLHLAPSTGQERTVHQVF